MTIFTDVGRLYVGQVLAGGINAIVTACAIAGDVHVIEIRWSPGVCRMTIITGITAREMRGVLAGGCDAVVTGVTGAHNLCVIDSEHRRKDIGVVAVFTDVTGLNVRQILAHRIHAVVAVDAISGDFQMIEIGWQPPCRGVAIVTRIPACQMIQVFAGCGNAIMTGTAFTDHLHVIDNVRRCKGGRTVAVLANYGGLYVGRVLARRGGSIVTTAAVVENIGVIEIGWQPGRAGVTVVAIRAARNMRWMFAGRGNAVVAGAAFAQNLRVIHRECWCPDIWVVAVLADVGRLYVREVLASGIDAVVATYAVARNV